MKKIVIILISTCLLSLSSSAFAETIIFTKHQLEDNFRHSTTQLNEGKFIEQLVIGASGFVEHKLIYRPNPGGAGVTCTFMITDDKGTIKIHPDREISGTKKTCPAGMSSCNSSQLQEYKVTCKANLSGHTITFKVTANPI